MLTVVAGGSGLLGTAIRKMLPGKVVTLDTERPRGRGAYVRCDVTHRLDVYTACREVGFASALVYAAGQHGERFWIDLFDYRAWHRAMAVYLDGAFYLLRELLPGMVNRGFGRIVLLGSVYGGVAPDFDLYPKRCVPPPAYCAAKAGLLGLARWVAVRCGKRGVTCNVVSPAGVVGSVSDARLRRRLERRMPSGHLVDPADVARAVRFCLETPSLNGQELVVDGGWRAR